MAKKLNLSFGSRGAKLSKEPQLSSWNMKLLYSCREFFIILIKIWLTHPWRQSTFFPSGFPHCFPIRTTKNCKMKRDFRFRDSYTYENHLQYDPKELVFLFLSVLGFSITCRCYRILSNLQSMSHYFVCSKLSETRSNFLRWHDSFSNHKTQQAKNAGACFTDLQWSRFWCHNYTFACQLLDLRSHLNSGNSATCQNYHGDVYASVYFWNFKMRRQREFCF